jgi:PAS domain S-box-containing protein
MVIIGTEDLARDMRSAMLMHVSNLPDIPEQKSEQLLNALIKIGHGVMGRTAEIQRPILVEDVSCLNDYVPGIPGARSELAVPLISKNRLVGVLNVESPTAGAFSADDVEPLMTLGRQAAIAIENARLYERLSTMGERMRLLHEFNGRILNRVSLGIYTVDRDLTITSWNRRMAEMSGIEADRAIGACLLELFPNLVEEGVSERIHGVLESGERAKLRLLHRQLDGTNRFQKRRLAPLRDGDEVCGVVVIVEDITEFKSLLDQTVQSEKLVEIGRLSAALPMRSTTHCLWFPTRLICCAVSRSSLPSRKSFWRRSRRS